MGDRKIKQKHGQVLVGLWRRGGRPAYSSVPNFSVVSSRTSCRSLALQNRLLPGSAASAASVAIWLSAFLAILPAVARADAGAVRASKRDDQCQVTVFSDPT